MANSFGKYTGGIAPVQGLYEMGSQIGRNYAAGITAVSQNITKGIEDYYKIKNESEYADAQLDSFGQKYTALATMLGSEPETAHLVEGLTPILDTIAKGRKGSHSAKMASVAAVDAQGKSLSDTFNQMGLVQNAKFRRLYEEGLLQPPEGEESRVMSFGANPEDTKWSPNLSYNANVERVSGNYDKWIEQNADAIRNGKLNVIPKAQFLTDWKKRLPSVIQSHPKLNEAQKAHALDILSRNQMLEGVNIDEESDPLIRGLMSFDQNWDTINPYIGTGESKSSASSRASNAGGAMATPAKSAGNHPQAEQLYFENRRLIAEAKQLQGKVGTRWFGAGDDADRERIKEINKQLNDNQKIIETLGGYTPPAPQPVPVRPEAAVTGLPAISLPVEPSAVIPEKVVEDNEPKVAPPRVAPVVVPRVVEPPMFVAPPKAVTPPAVVAPPKVVEQPQAPVIVPQKVAPTTATPQAVKPSTAPVSANNTSGRATGNSDYVAIKGETLHSIARDAGVTRAALAKANGVNLNHDFKAGDRIFIPPTAEQNRAADRPDVSHIRIGEESSTPNSTESISPEDVGSDNAVDTGVEQSSYDPETGNLVINADILAKRKQEIQDDAVGEEDLPTGEFKPLTLRPLNTSKPMETPRLPEGVKKSYTPDELDDIKIARRHIEETNAELESQNRSVKPAIDYLQRIKNNVLNGDASSVDFGHYGEWQKAHPDAATAISVGTQAAAMWIGGGWSKTAKFANSIEASNYASKRLSQARSITEKLIDGKMKKFGRALTDEEIGESVAWGLKKAGLASKEKIAGDAAKFGEAVRKSTAKSMFWETLALELAGSPDTQFSIPDDSNNEEIRKELKDTLGVIRNIRTVKGGNSQFVPFGWNDTKISGHEIKAIKTEIDNRIAKLKTIAQNNDNEILSLKSNATPDNLLSLAKNLETDSKAKLAAIKIAKNNGIPMDGDYVDEDIDVGSQPIASKEVVIPQSNEQKKTQMKEYIRSRLGHIPAGFEDVWRKQFPESTLQVKETPYGVFFTDKSGEWKQVAAGKEGKQLQPHEIAANRAVQFGQLRPDGTYEPTELVAGSGIKLGGLGAFGSPAEGSKFRSEYGKKIRAVRIAKELQDMNEITFRSFMPSEWGRSKAKVAGLVAQLRQELIGVGSVSDFEQKLLQDLVTNPTDFFKLQSEVRTKYEELISRLSTSLVEEPQLYGLDVQMPKDKTVQLKNMRALYKAQEAKYKDKMQQFKE